jgi:hypothetical protein
MDVFVPILCVNPIKSIIERWQYGVAKKPTLRNLSQLKALTPDLNEICGEQIPEPLIAQVARHYWELLQPD